MGEESNIPEFPNDGKATTPGSGNSQIQYTPGGVIIIPVGLAGLGKGTYSATEPVENYDPRQTLVAFGKNENLGIATVEFSASEMAKFIGLSSPAAPLSKITQLTAEYILPTIVEIDSMPITQISEKDLPTFDVEELFKRYDPGEHSEISVTTPIQSLESLVRTPMGFFYHTTFCNTGKQIPETPQIQTIKLEQYRDVGVMQKEGYALLGHVNVLTVDELLNIYSSVEPILIAAGYPQILLTDVTLQKTPENKTEYLVWAKVEDLK